MVWVWHNRVHRVGTVAQMVFYVSHISSYNFDASSFSFSLQISTKMKNWSMLALKVSGSVGRCSQKCHEIVRKSLQFFGAVKGSKYWQSNFVSRFECLLEDKICMELLHWGGLLKFPAKLQKTGSKKILGLCVVVASDQSKKKRLFSRQRDSKTNLFIIEMYLPYAFSGFWLLWPLIG